MHESPERYTREQVYEKAAQLAWLDPENAEVAWRQARAAYTMAQEPGVPAARKKELTLQALKLITDAKARERGNGNIYRWAGIILSAAGDYAGTAEYIKNAFVIRCVRACSGQRGQLWQRAAGAAVGK
jgi:hypothetical protein